MLIKIELLDELLQRYAGYLGNDFTGYRNHVYRVINFCCSLNMLDAVDLEKIVVAGVFHDLGIWTAKTFDYLPPSEQLAKDFLREIDKLGWAEEIISIIHNHHKITRSHTDPQNLAEVFRKADWIDVSHGAVTFGLSRQKRREVFSAFPDAGFHFRLVQLSLKRLLTNPLSPLPMMRL
ncbi:HD domain-containing protein [Pseudomonas sp. S2_A02]